MQTDTGYHKPERTSIAYGHGKCIPVTITTLQADLRVPHLIIPGNLTRNVTHSRPFQKRTIVEKRTYRIVELEFY